MQDEHPASLPAADETSAQHSALAATAIRAMIERSGGQISFAEFMHAALYAPGLGYYSAGSTKFGAAGDFVTAPEVSSVFGRVLARQVAEILCGIDGGEILEFGAGSGKLAVDLLQALAALDALPSTYRILEVSADLQEKQRQRLREELPELADRVVWIAELPRDFEGVMVANEVLDALPVERFVRRGTGVFQHCVATENDRFVWVERPASPPLIRAVEAIESELGEKLPNAYVSEVSLAAPQWVHDLAAGLKLGAVILFDYGVSQKEYYAAARSDGWLRCHFRHHAHNDPLILPGIQDITSWVDFSAVASAAVNSGLDLLGYQAQAQFLMGGGLEIEMAGFAELSVEQQIQLSGEIKRLTLPGEMGEHFKCIAFGRGDIETPSAFRFADRTQTL
jgi:SAM-dependent MidA family methyltransferase